MDRPRLTPGRRKSTLKAVAAYVKEHYPNASYGVYPIENDTKIAVIIVANKYSPSNYWWVDLARTQQRSERGKRETRGELHGVAAD